MEPELVEAEMVLPAHMKFKKIQMYEKYPKGQARVRWKHLKQIIQAENYQNYPPNEPNWHGYLDNGRSFLDSKGMNEINYVVRISIMMNVAEMRMLRWMCGHTKKDRLRNEAIREKVRVASIEDKMMNNRLRWFGHVRRRPVDAPVRRLESWGTSNIVKGRGRPKKTWIKLIENDMRFLGIGENVNIESPPSLHPCKRICDITGYEAPYLDPRTKLRYANTEVFKVIRSLPDEYVQRYLALRNAAVVLR
ncbi:hypothetical protein OROMI_028240 [Orobanche minor]